MVGPTIGPMPRSVLIEQKAGPPRLATSALDVLEALEVEDRGRNAVLGLLRETGRTLRRETGDGVATMLLLTQELVRGSMRRIRSGEEAIAEAGRIREAAGAACLALEKERRAADSRELLIAAASSACGATGA